MSETKTSETAFERARVFTEVDSSSPVSERLAIPRKPVVIGRSPELGGDVWQIDKLNGPNVFNISELRERVLKSWYQSRLRHPPEGGDGGDLPPHFAAVQQTLLTIIGDYSNRDPDYLNKIWYTRLVTGPSNHFHRQATRLHIDDYAESKKSIEYIVSNIDTTRFLLAGVNIDPGQIDGRYADPSASAYVSTACEKAAEDNPDAIWWPQPGEIVMFDETMPHQSFSESGQTRAYLLVVFEDKQSRTPVAA